ncbi:MAG TPA: methyltransferase [Burkholderiaceae bacterium]
MHESLAAWALFCGQRIWRNWTHLADSVRSGSSATRRSGGQDDFAHLDADPPAADLFHRAMTNLTRPVAAAFAASIDLEGELRVVDVGGGYGQLLVALLLAHPRLRGVLFDLPHAIEPAVAQIARLGLIARCELVSGSFFDSLPAGGDVYLLKSVLHDWDDAHCVRILQHCRQAMAGRPGARLFVIERLAPEHFAATPRDRAIARSDLNMPILRSLLNRSGPVRTQRRRDVDWSLDGRGGHGREHFRRQSWTDPIERLSDRRWDEPGQRRIHVSIARRRRRP